MVVNASYDLVIACDVNSLMNVNTFVYTIYSNPVSASRVGTRWPLGRPLRVHAKLSGAPRSRLILRVLRAREVGRALRGGTDSLLFYRLNILSRRRKKKMRKERGIFTTGKGVICVGMRI